MGTKRGRATIRATLIRDICLNPDAYGVPARGLRIARALVKKQLDLHSGSLERPLEFSDCKFDEPVDLTDARVRTVTFGGCEIPGISAGGLRVDGDLYIESSKVLGEVSLMGARVEGLLNCAGTKLENPDGPALSADRIETGGSIFLRGGFTAKGAVRLPGANIGGDLSCSGATLENPDGNALHADGMETGGSVFLRGGFTAKGEVRLLGANIGGTLSCVGATLENPDGDALSADGIETGGSVFLRGGFTAKGAVRLLGANIGGALSCVGATLENPDGSALHADGMETGGGVFLRGGFTAKGEVRLLGTKIGGDLECSGATLENPDGNALSADGMETGGSVFLDDGFAAKGEVRLLGARIGGQLACSGATLENPGGYALCADGMETGGDVFLRGGFTAKGEVRLLGANIGGDLSCIGATLENPDGNALHADRMETGGGVFLRGGFTAKGAVRLPGAKVGGSLDCTDATLENPDRNAFSAQRMVVEGGIFWRNFQKPPVGNVNFTHASASVFVDDGTGWPADRDLFLDGFSYKAFGPGMNCKQRLEWLRRQPSDWFFPQPYEQVIKVFKNAGREHDARAIAIAKRDDFCERGNLSRRHRLWLKLLRATVRYGYEPWRILGYIGVALAFALMVFNSGYQNGLIHPSKERVFVDDCYVDFDAGCGGWITEQLKWTDHRIRIPADYPEFNALVYAADAFFPFVNLHQEDFWLPKADGRRGGLLRFYLWLHIALGWILSTIAVLGFTGVFKKD